MLERITRYIQENELIREKEHLLLGVSGGADSVFLLYVLCQLREPLSLTLSALHVHHGLRGEEAERDAAFTRQLCERLRVPCQVERVDVAGLAEKESLSVETAGRQLRYESLRRWRERLGCDRIVVAHHRDDHAETVLFRLLRGSGLRGLSGMRPENGDIVRPLLFLSREEIRDFLQQEGIPFCEDSTNAEDDCSRNRLRHQLLPAAEEAMERPVAENIVRSAALIAEAEDYLRGQAQAACQELVRPQGEGLFLAVQAAELHPALLSEVLRQMLERLLGETRDLTCTHIVQLRGLLKKQVGRQLTLPFGLLARRSYEGLWLGREEEKGERAELPSPRIRVFSYKNGEKIPEKRYTKWFDYDKIQESVQLRHRQRGDTIAIAPSGKKTIKEFMIHEKIPRAERDAIWLLADGCRILWVVGYRISEYYKVTEKTCRVLEVTMEDEDGGEYQGASDQGADRGEDPADRGSDHAGL